MNVNSAPIFVVGCGRSGTTMLRTILDKHPDLAIPPESLFIVDYLKAQKFFKGPRLLKSILSESELSEWGIRFAESDFNDLELNAGNIITRCHEIYSRSRGKVIWGQKTPRFVRFLPLLCQFYPRARVIHVVRDPRAVVSSLINSNVHRSNALFAALRWRRDAGAGHAAMSQDPGNILEIRYEDYVTEPGAVTAEICEFLGIPFVQEMIENDGQALPEYNNSYYSSVHHLLTKPPDSSRISAWQGRLSDRELAVVEWICSDLMNELDYKHKTQLIRPRFGYLSYLVAQRFWGFVTQVIHSLSNRPSYIPSVLKRKAKIALSRLSNPGSS